MERSSPVYKLRRNLQVMAHRLLPDVFLAKLYYRILLKKKLDLKTPKTFNEKIQWCKLFYFPKEPAVVQCTDKIAVRSFVEQAGLGHKLVPLYGVWDRAEDMDWNSLPEQFVLKCNHGCAYNLVCPKKCTFDRAAAARQLNRWLKEDFGAFNIELHYSQIKERKILCEQYLGAAITDYKFFCFHGEPKYMYVSRDLIHDRQAEIGFFYLDGNKMPLTRDDYKDLPEILLPPCFEDMKAAAQVLCQDFLFVRVDFFLTDQDFYFAEMTFTPGAGVMPFRPESFDAAWGELLQLPMDGSGELR